ncbi:MAG: IS200/IS605 family transposase [Flavisolibacter sp.]|jgi:putative transposase
MDLIAICSVPNTYTQIHIHSVFAVKYRNAVILESWRERIHQYITGILQKSNHKMIAINSMPDHSHLLFGFRPTQSLSDLMRIVKSDTSEWINKQKFTKVPFRWQEGYGAFSYSKSQIPIVAHYIEQQQIHHQKKTFLEEYEDLLKGFAIPYDQKYIFTCLE